MHQAGTDLLHYSFVTRFLSLNTTAPSIVPSASSMPSGLHAQLMIF
jgi:hypothetical protein